MRILNVQLKYIHGGNPQVCLDYTRVLKKAGNVVCVLTNHADPFFDKHAAMADQVIKSKRVGKYGSYDLFSILYYRAVVREFKPDLIIVHDGRSSVLIKRAVGKSVAVIDVNHGRSARQSAQMDATIVTNKAQLSRYNEFFQNSHKVFYLPNSMNLEGHVKPAIPRDWNDIPVIGTIGRFAADKALDIFIDALAILDKRGVNFRVKMAGDGDERENIVNQINANNLQEKISLCGWQKNPDEFYKTIDIFCFPSRKEEFGLVLLEAYKNGLPAVVSDADGPSDIVENGVDALMVPKENADALADALQKILENKALADILAQAGYEKLISNYDVPVIAKRLQAFLDDLMVMHGYKLQFDSVVK